MFSRMFRVGVGPGQRNRKCGVLAGALEATMSRRGRCGQEESTMSLFVWRGGANLSRWRWYRKVALTMSRWMC